MAIREAGDWEGWLRFFLRAVAESSEEATFTARAIVRLREQHRELIQSRHLGTNAHRMLDLLFHRPIINVALAKESLDISGATVGRLVTEFETLNLLEEITGGQRRRRYRYSPYLALFAETAANDQDFAPRQVTESEPA